MPDVNPAPEPRTFDAIIIGAGFSGLYQLLSLRDRLGMKVQVLEAGDGVGGTWYWNRYPGARCDSESHIYNYTFSKELFEGWEWSERYPEQPEIMRYMNYVADHFDLRRDIRFGTRVVGARYDDAAERWSVTTEAGETLTAQFLITAVGCLSTANVPDIPGLGDFAGQWYHSGEWPHEGVDFTGKRVGLVGTGSTGIQATPVIAEAAAHLTVFQRTANYSVPAQNAPLTPEFKQWVRQNHAEVRRATRSTTNGQAFAIEDRSVFDVTPEERLAIYEAAWAKGGLQFRATFRDLLLDKAANDTAAEFLKNKIREIVKDPATADLLADIDHPYAAKRPPIDSGYFASFNRDNVTLVDVRAAPIERITPAGIRTGAAEYPLDIIVFATGFDALTGPLLKLNIQGRGGQPLARAWEAGPRNYLGLQVAGFPNLFTITGPGSPSVLTNMPVAIEQHVDWITDCIAHMRARGLTHIETSEAAMDGWVARVNAAANATLLPQAHHSWYLGANVPGKPRVFMPYAGGMIRYRAICEEVAAKGYEGFTLRSLAPAV
ncbi:cation diffusion facilitator CzcD-associated flavoprotein CzcO [Humitalea rosea]|uniref:Cation diffusion facilitator CzcD-associated flavoprotein CzcO n=1 Tax=Humitalea rosea TaxID=990373 RepID=A0A2W7JSC8_9PROT|nr:NAD(P)/FAD-dependent oxidoreductase [Humitalea rosea]PZW37836.1 cation diffusion facilitator CzcD-associated flavoprotein CzcO [Humitalea rosea]